MQPPPGPPPPVAGYPAQPAPGYGYPPPGQPPPPGYGYYEPPPPPPPPGDDPATIHTHDGFYMRLGFGLGWGRVTSEIGDLEVEYSGSGWLLDMLFGGTIANTVVIGGGFLLHEISDPDVNVTSGEVDVAVGEASGGLGVGTLGPFIDIFPDPNGGGHFGAMIGVGTIGLEDESGDASSGWGFGVFGGYDFWVSNQWSLGANARYMYNRGKREGDTVLITEDGGALLDTPSTQETAHTFGILFSALYH